ncbi:MAG: hypothetical protein BMS9Abin37_3094 [Acidobacteriota bacterium]|nr:MAG: hypothetical protein BMS9Abin37_3094 [Acidobacteriota bacterium]
MDWIEEGTTSWDADKKRILGDAPAGIFDRRYTQLAASRVTAWLEKRGFKASVSFS